MNDIKLDWLAEEILATFAELGFNMSYIEDKRHSLAGKDRFAVLIWCNNLDSKCKKALAERLGVSLDNFIVTLQTLTRL
jgi:hypothetical protein